MECKGTGISDGPTVGLSVSLVDASRFGYLDGIVLGCWIVGKKDGAGNGRLMGCIVGTLVGLCSDGDLDVKWIGKLDGIILGIVDGIIDRGLDDGVAVEVVGRIDE